MWCRATAAEDIDDRFDPVLRLETAHQGRIAVLLQDHRRDQCRLQALSGPPADNFAEGPQRITAAFPVVGQRTQEALDLLGGAAAPDDPPLSARKRLLWRRVPERGHGPTYSKEPRRCLHWLNERDRDQGHGTRDSNCSNWSLVLVGGPPCLPVSPRSRRPKRSAST